MKGQQRVERVKKVNNESIETIIANMKKIAKDYLIVSSAIQYKKSQEIILKKISNENAAISYGISLINRKVIENPEKYSDIEKEIKELMKQYQNNIEELANYYDTQILLSFIKIYEEELKQINLQQEIYYLMQDEKIAKTKVDNSDDEIREKICNLEDEVSKIEIKIRRMKPNVKKKIIEKEEELAKAIETKENAIQKEKIKGPKVFSKAAKFFMGKIKPHKLIEKNVFSNLKNRLELYENEEKPKKKINEKYLEENIIQTINEITNENGGL